MSSSQANFGLPRSFRNSPSPSLGGDSRLSLDAAFRYPLGSMELVAFGAAGLLVNRCSSQLGDLLPSLRASLGLALGYPLPGGFAALSS